MTANLVGSLLLGILLGAVAAGATVGDEVVLLFGTGLLGAFTTMSAFAVDSIRLAENNPSSTLIMITTTILGSIAWLGLLALFDIHNCVIQQELLITNVEVHIRLALVGHSDAAKGELRMFCPHLWYSRVHVTRW